MENVSIVKFYVGDVQFFFEITNCPIMERDDKGNETKNIDLIKTEEALHINITTFVKKNKVIDSNSSVHNIELCNKNGDLIAFADNMSKRGNLCLK